MQDLGSREGIAKAKAEISFGLKPQGLLSTMEMSHY